MNIFTLSFTQAYYSSRVVGWSFVVTSSLSVVFLICPLVTSGVLRVLSLFYLIAKLQSWFLLVLGLSSCSYHCLVLAKFADL